MSEKTRGQKSGQDKGRGGGGERDNGTNKKSEMVRGEKKRSLTIHDKSNLFPLLYVQNCVSDKS